MNKVLGKQSAWIINLLRQSNLLEADQVIACINNGSKPIIIDQHSLIHEYDAILESRTVAFQPAKADQYEYCLHYSTIELLNNIRSSHDSYLIIVALPVEGGRFLIYLSPDKKKLLGCIFNGNKQIKVCYYAILVYRNSSHCISHCVVATGQPIYYTVFR